MRAEGTRLTDRSFVSLVHNFSPPPPMLAAARAAPRDLMVIHVVGSVDSWSRFIDLVLDIE